MDLKYNIAEFSAFKETSFRKQIESRLTKNGRVLSWSEFKKETDKLNLDYNRKWLKTEYDQTVANANAAEKFKNYQKQKHLYPNLEYKTIGDEKVRGAHKSMDGIVLPVDDPFWQKFLPPNDWGCRCYVLQTAKPVNKPNETDLAVKKDFANNPAISGKIFKENAYKKGLNKKEVEKAKENTEKWSNKQQYNTKTFKSGGELQTPKEFNQNPQEEQKNIKAYTILAKEHGDKYRLLNVANENGVKNPDALNLKTNKFSDAKIPTSLNGKNAVQNSIKSASGQKVVKEVYIYLEHDYPMMNIWQGLKSALQNGRAKTIETIVIKLNNGIVKKYKTEKLKKIFSKK